jgi:dihydroorotate dehydrogenase electron transfer subunit
MLPGMIPTALAHRGQVVEQVRLADHTYRIRVDCPPIATQIVPGQFFMIRPAGGSDPLLGRPFALYDVVRDAAGRQTGIDFVYHVIGKMTGLMADWTGGEPVELWGPLGNGFPVPTGNHLLCVGGGIGYTPFLAVCREATGQGTYGDPPRPVSNPLSRTTLCYGVRTQSVRADLGDFEDIPGFESQIATDDGSEGHHGFVTELVEHALSHPETDRPDQVYCCGPEVMMRAVADLCAREQVPCWLSLESPMACGFGACFSCVTKVRIEEDPGWDYRRTCVEGPVFPADSLVLS